MEGRRRLDESTKKGKYSWWQVPTRHCRPWQNETIDITKKKKSNAIGKKVKKTILRNLEHADTTVLTRKDGPTVQFWGNSVVACKSINGHFCGSKKKGEEFVKYKRPCIVEWEDYQSNFEVFDDFAKTRFSGNTTRKLTTWSTLVQKKKTVIVKCEDPESVKKPWKVVGNGSFKKQWQKWILCGDQRRPQGQMGDKY